MPLRIWLIQLVSTGVNKKQCELHFFNNCSDKSVSTYMNCTIGTKKMMSILQKDVEDVMLETVGGLLKEAINDALSAGVDGFCDQDKKNVRQAMEVGETLI